MPTAKDVNELPRLVAWRTKGTVTKGLFHVGNLNGRTRLLLVHGYPTASADFRRLMPALESRFAVLAWDMMGYGFSDKVYRTVSQQVDLLEELLGATSENPLAFHVLSHDLGDTVAQEMLARCLDEKPCFRVESLVALNGGLLPGMHRPLLTQRLLLNPVLGPALAWFMSIHTFAASISKVFGIKPSDEDVEEFYALVMRGDGRSIAHLNIRYMTDRVENKDRYESALKRWSDQTGAFLLIDGPCDPVSGRHLAEAVQRDVPKARVVYLADDVGHWPQLEAPRPLLDAFFAFHVERGTLVDMPDLDSLEIPP